MKCIVDFLRPEFNTFKIEKRLLLEKFKKNHQKIRKYLLFIIYIEYLAKFLLIDQKVEIFILQFYYILKQIGVKAKQN